MIRFLMVVVFVALSWLFAMIVANRYWSHLSGPLWLIASLQVSLLLFGCKLVASCKYCSRVDMTLMLLAARTKLNKLHELAILLLVLSLSVI